MPVRQRQSKLAASGFHLFTFAPSPLGMSALPPEADVRSVQACVRFGPQAAINAWNAHSFAFSAEAISLCSR